LKPVSSAEALSACLAPLRFFGHTSRTIVSNSRLRHLDQCSMPTVSHPTRFDTRPKCSRRPCTCSDICISSSAQPAKPGIHAGSQKYACSCQMQAGLPCTSPKPCNGPSIPPIEGITCIHAASQKFPYFCWSSEGVRWVKKPACGV
jgi:hypothetical protein